MAGVALLALQREPAPAGPATPVPRVLAPMASAARPVLAPAAAATAEPFLRAQVARLEATHDAADAFKAYRLLADCAAFMADHDRMIYDESAFKHPERGQIPGFRGMTDQEKRHDTVFCAAMSERERQSRLDDLALAVKAMVPGAASAFVREGPFGDMSALRTRPGDPLVQAWKAAAKTQLVRAAESGTDMDALLDLAVFTGGGNEVLDDDPRLAYRYKLALGFIYADKFGAGSMPGKEYAPDSPSLAILAQDLSPEARAAELADARRIADKEIAARRGR